MMFNKLSFAELAQLYTAVADLEKHYGKEATHEAMVAMADRLDRPAVEGKIEFNGKNLTELTTVEKVADIWSPWIMHELKKPVPGETVRLIDETAGIDVEAVVGPESSPQQLELLPKSRKLQSKVKQTAQRVEAEKIARKWGFSNLDTYLIDRYYIQKYKQSEIANHLNVNQTTISNWLGMISQKEIQKAVSK